MVAMAKERTERSNLVAIQGVLRSCNELDGDMTVRMVSILLYIATNDGCAIGDIARDLDVTLPTVSRTVQYFSNVLKFQVPGKGLVEAVEDERDRRVKRVFISPKGRKFIAGLSEALEENL